jgi:hypothetical protein
MFSYLKEESSTNNCNTVDVPRGEDILSIDRNIGTGFRRREHSDRRRSMYTSRRREHCPEYGRSTYVPGKCVTPSALEGVGQLGLERNSSWTLQSYTTDITLPKTIRICIPHSVTFAAGSVIMQPCLERTQRQPELLQL